METKTWKYGHKFRRECTTELVDETINIINKYGIPYRLMKTPYGIMFKRGLYKYIFYITTDKWDVRHPKNKIKSYYSKGIEDFICRFLLDNDKQKINFCLKRGEELKNESV